MALRQQCPERMQGKAQQRSGYSPLDLFSEDRDRMRSALLELLQCPQNNLKVAAGGRAVVPPAPGADHEDDLQAALRHLFPRADPAARIDAFVRLLVVRAVVETCALLALYSIAHVRPCTARVGFHRALPPAAVDAWLLTLCVFERSE